MEFERRKDFRAFRSSLGHKTGSAYILGFGVLTLGVFRPTEPITEHRVTHPFCLLCGTHWGAPSLRFSKWRKVKHGAATILAIGLVLSACLHRSVDIAMRTEDHAHRS